MAKPTNEAAPNSPDPPPQKARELTTRVLDFIATANNETLGACIVGLGAVTYLVLGRMGLVLIGAVGGIVLHATWEGERGGAALRSDPTERERRREVGLDVVKRLLDIQNQRQGKEKDNGQDKAELEVMLASRKELNFDEFQPETAAALTGLVDAVIRDYVNWWYAPILPGEKSFPFEARQTLTAFLLAASNHISHKRPADTFLNFLTNSTSIFIVFLSELSNALMVPNAQDSDVGDRIRTYLKENPDSNLANVLNEEEQKKKFNMVADDVLQTFLDSKVYNCEPAKVFLREVFAGLILEMSLQTFSKRDWINGWIVYLLEEGESEIISVIDAGVGSATGKQPAIDKSGQADQKSSEVVKANVGHKRSASKAEQAMEEAMAEAKRLSELIAEEEAKKSHQAGDTSSSVSTDQAVTPTSSQSEMQATAQELQQRVEESAALAKEEASNEEAPSTARGFTSFDQILPPQTAYDPEDPPPLTLHKASVAIFDDSQPGESGKIRSKPIVEYLLQIEPASSLHRGWMTARKYSDFETLHEVLRRISIISGVPEFAQKHSSLPVWKGQTKASLRTELEKYLRDALLSEPLAESEGMKRFLEKEQALGRPAPSKGLGFPTPEAFQSMGKGMLDVLASAPKGAAGGGKALLSGVSGVFGGPKRAATETRSRGTPPRSDSSAVQPSTPDAALPRASTTSFASRPSQDSFRVPSEENSRSAPPLPERPATDGAGLGVSTEDVEDSTKAWGSHSSSMVDVSRPSSQASGLESLANSDFQVHLPPPPSEIPDDYNDSSTQETVSSLHNTIPTPASLHNMSQTSPSSPKLDQLSTSTSNLPVSTVPSAVESRTDIDNNTAEAETVAAKQKATKAASRMPLTEQEASVAVELIFALIQELYTLSSAWQIRRTLLNAAKTFLLRPGNPSLESIRVLLQNSAIDANTSDAGLALQLRKLRENTLPTEEELKTWPPPLTTDESEALQAKARKLLVSRGMPAALTSVMGAAASGEALGRVFDSLQVEEVARGLFFALLLQGVRAVKH